MFLRTIVIAAMLLRLSFTKAPVSIVHKTGKDWELAPLFGFKRKGEAVEYGLERFGYPLSWNGRRNWKIVPMVVMPRENSWR